MKQKLITYFSFKKILLYFAMIGSGLTLNSGCVSGGFKLTRDYAGFVNRQNIVLRVILYILTFVVFAVTLIIDAVVFNTMDFWEGRISSGIYHFEEQGTQYVVNHQIDLQTKLKHTHIKIISSTGELTQFKILETLNGQIELWENNELKMKTDQIKEAFPKITLFENRNKVQFLNEVKLTVF